MIGPFRLLEQLGQGAQGEVWKAERLEAGQQPRAVALKILNPDLIRSSKRLAQFRHEAERGAKLDGPSLLQVTEFGQVDRFLYMVMPLIEGTTLQVVIKNRRAYLRGRSVEADHRLIFLDEERYQRAAVRVMIKAARALGRIHSCRVVHRDVKPANILLDGRAGCDAYLCDLGLGRDLEHATPQQMRDGAGTPMYMAPERLLKAPSDEILGDIYSLGVTIFQTVTLEHPFTPPRALPLSCLSLYLASCMPERPSTLKPEIAPELEEVILKAMARDPAKRFHSADEIADALERIHTRKRAAATRIAEHPAHRGARASHPVHTVMRPSVGTQAD